MIAHRPSGTLRASVRLVLLLLVCVPGLAMRCPLHAQVSREYDVKAVFLLNFARFVEWPSDAFSTPETPFTIGIFGVDPFSRALDDVVHNEKVGGRWVAVERFSRVEDVTGCHILFISASETRRVAKVLEALKNRPVLTVSDMDQFVPKGGMIRLFTEETKVRLRINNDAARKARLVISSKLLRVAEVVTSASPD